ncbi:MAG: CotH kinase family protein, partial [Verrucomicrobiales bacterium]
SSVYARHNFQVAPDETPQLLRLRHNVDDGFIAYINGVEVVRVRADGAGAFDDVASSSQSPEGEWAEVELAAGAVVEGENVLAIVAYNQSLTTSDFAFDFELIRPAIPDPEPVPTPGAQNSAFATNAPPNIRQVEHSPQQPNDSESTVVTAKVSDVDGVDSVLLQYQVVLPGDYIPALLAKPHSTLLSNPNGPRDPNPRYNDPANWESLAMLDDGNGGDAVAGDQIFTATLPPQINRTLVRYRITVTDVPGASVRVPYDDDPSLNFAYFVYNGVPDFVAATRSVTGQTPYIHPKEALTSLPVYTMLTTQADFDQCVAYSSNQISSGNADARSAFNWGATFVYDGVVYDNIAYRLRQRNARYSGNGKRSFRFRFNDGQFIQLHDDNGDPYPTKWRSLNSHKNTGSRGGVNFGLYEAANSFLWKLTGSPAPLTNWFHFRVVKGAEEQPAGENGQHLGDFYGMLLAMEDYDVRFLETHDLPRGNLYKLKTGGNDGLSIQRYQAKGAVEDASDFTNIINQLRNNKSDSWLREHVDWDAYYKYKVIVDAVRHYDVSSGITTNNGEHLKNRSYFFEPDPADPGGLGKLNLLPWDSDTSWGPNWNGGWDWPKNAMDDREEFNKEYKNVVREFRDLVWQEDQINPLLDHFQSQLEVFQLADRDRWTGATGSPNPGSQSDGPMATRVADMKRFAFDGGSWSGGNSANRDFIFDASGQIVASNSISRDDGVSGSEGRDAYLDALAFDPAIPAKPTISYTGEPGHPINGLAFEASDFSDPQGSGTFAAMEWRIAEIAPPGDGLVNIFDAGQDWKYLDDGSNQGTAWQLLDFDESAWVSGPAPLGFGGIRDTPEFGTVISSGPAGGPRNITAYFRRTVEIPDPDRFTSFTFKLHADDGAVVYVNGTEVIRDRFDSGTDIRFDTLANSAGNEGEFDEFTVAAENFVPGTNIIAVEVHQNTTGSGDFVFDLAVDATEQRPLLFEWNASWESGELATQQTQIEIPASATREGRFYRARVRYQDDSMRWSQWSDPAEFIPTLPDIQPLLDNLVISEFMYHPTNPAQAELDAGFSDQDDFEFIELLNVSPDQTLDLTDVRFTKGIDFDFPPGTMIAPGEYLLVARNQAAMEFRYGPGLPIIGEYLGNAEGNLSNGGERLKLSFGSGVPIRDLEYDDSLPWPVAADGSGASLVLVAPASVPDHALAASWIASAASGGSPGQPGTDAITFADWLEGFGITEPAPDPDFDRDNDGLSQFLEFALVGDPTQSLSSERPQAGVIEVGDEAYLTITFRRQAAASGVNYAVEFSGDLATWAASGVLISATPGPDNSVIETWRASSAMSLEAETFGRVRVSQ